MTANSRYILLNWAIYRSVQKDSEWLCILDIFLFIGAPVGVYRKKKRKYWGISRVVQKSNE